MASQNIGIEESDGGSCANWRENQSHVSRDGCVVILIPRMLPWLHRGRSRLRSSKLMFNGRINRSANFSARSDEEKIMIRKIGIYTYVFLITTSISSDKHIKVGKEQECSRDALKQNVLRMCNAKGHSLHIARLMRRWPTGLNCMEATSGVTLTNVCVLLIGPNKSLDTQFDEYDETIKTRIQLVLRFCNS